MLDLEIMGNETKREILNLYNLYRDQVINNSINTVLHEENYIDKIDKIFVKQYT